jgi:predicted nucleic acid-binding protein
LSTLLLDAGVWLGAADSTDPFHDAARSLVFDERRQVAALDLTLYEIANVLGVRKKEPRDALHLSELMLRRCRRGSLVAADPSLLHVAGSVAIKHGLSAYDAAYVAAANSNGWTLVSADIRDLVSKGLAVAPDAADYP